jgi:hypothetical protein
LLLLLFLIQKKKNPNESLLRQFTGYTEKSLTRRVVSIHDRSVCIAGGPVGSYPFYSLVSFSGWAFSLVCVCLFLQQTPLTNSCV